MDTGSRRVSRLDDGAGLVVAVMTVTVAITLALVIVGAELLPPAAEPIVAAPNRWSV